MRIALIHCPFGHRVFSENLKVVDEDFCLAPPIILAYVAAIAEKAGHKVMLIDAHALKLTREKTLRILKEFSPDVVGFRADTYWFHTVREWADYIKHNLNTIVIVGGLNVSLYPQESLSYNCFDYGIAGEAIEPLPQLLYALENKAQVDTIKGLIYKKDNAIVCNPSSDKAIPFDKYPFPARHLLPNRMYYSFASQRKNFTVMLTSTGCPYKCKFCAIVPLAYRQRQYLKVADEIEECYRRFHVREIDFFDGTFFINKEWSLQLCEEIIKKKIKVEWSCRSRVDVVDEDILKAAAAAGCRKIYYGIESASQMVLGNISKGINRDEIIRAINLTHKYGIHTLGFFMVGNPGDTKESIEESIRFAKKLKLDFIQVCRTIAKPNTELHRMLTEKNGRDYWREYILGMRPEERLPNPWSQLTEDEVEEYVRRFYAEFYFRPAYVLGRIYKAKSFEELFKYARTGLRWVFCNYSDVKR